MARLVNTIDAPTGLISLKKKAGESRLFDIECKGRLRDSDSISSVTSITPANLGRVTGSSNISVVTPQINGSIIQARYSGGTDQEAYQVTAVFDTTLGDQNVQADVILLVDDSF